MEKTNIKRAVTLCGGGSLGSYEIGVWRYLREEKIDFSIVTGTSIGAINGVFLATNEYDMAVSLWKEAAAEKVMANGLNFPRDFLKEFDWKNDRKKLTSFAKTFIRNGGADITPFMEWVKKAVPVKEVKESDITFGVVTASWPSFKEIDVNMKDVKEENVIDYLHASSACFPAFPVYTFDGKSYIDGGYNNNLPIDFALRLGADEVIAVLLHSIPRVPQHAELMKLPCVRCVIPTHDTGSILDFSQDVIMKNMELGYLDAKKMLGSCWGYSYCFEKDDKFLPLADRLSRNIAAKYLSKYFDIAKAIAHPEFEIKDSLSFFIRSLELIGEWLNLDYLKIYSIDDYIKDCQAIIRKKTNITRSMKWATSKKNWTERLPEDEKIDFIVYLDYLFTRNKEDSHIKKMAAKTPEVAVLIELLELGKEFNLLNNEKA